MVLNSAFLFIKPEAVNDEVKAFVEPILKEKGLRIIKKGELKSEIIDKKKLIDNHYYAIASKATILKPKELNVPADKFKGKFGIEWQAALDSGKVFNAMDGCEFFGVDAAGMSGLWAACKKADKLIKFGGGFYCGDIEHDGKRAYIFNGFFMDMRAGYVAPGKSIYYYVVTWDSKKLSWKDFREKVCGATDPEVADKGSVRGQIFAKWEELKLAKKPNVGDNSLHASASPFEGISERVNWLGFKMDKDVFGAPPAESRNSNEGS
jgi:nucleoside diphosphate kinase